MCKPSWNALSTLKSCLNAKELNNYRTPTVEEITDSFAGSTVFTKVDGIASYYCVNLMMNHSYSQLSTHHFAHIAFDACPQDLSAAKTYSRRKSTKSWNNALLSLESQMTSISMKRTSSPQSWTWPSSPQPDHGSDLSPRSWTWTPFQPCTWSPTRPWTSVFRSPPYITF